MKVFTDQYEENTIPFGVDAFNYALRNQGKFMIP